MTDGQATHASPDAGADSKCGADTGRTVDHVTPIPASIVKAICTIKARLEAVKKTQRNQHGGYSFASTDDIYAALARKMGEVGLIVLTNEDASEVVRVEKDGKISQWLKATYSFVLATVDGTWSDPRARRTLYIQITGPQTFQAAQSYAEKSYLRSVFKLPTGDMDLDAMPQAETEEGQLALTGQGGKRKSSSAAKKDGTSEVYNEIIKQVRGAHSVEMLGQIPDLFADEIGTLPSKWAQLYEDEYQDKMQELRGVMP